MSSLPTSLSREAQFPMALHELSPVGFEALVQEPPRLARADEAILEDAPKGGNVGRAFEQRCKLRRIIRNRAFTPAIGEQPNVGAFLFKAHGLHIGISEPIGSI